jgi:dethiobiotin synthetase
MIEAFVTGTDTAVGKTTVAAGLLAAAATRGLSTACLKPAESDCEIRDNELFPADAALLARAARATDDLTELCPYRFQEAVAPGVAADRTNVEIDFSRIRDTLEGLRARSPDLLVVEGAGGLLVPFGSGRLLPALISALDLALLIVARSGLGTINHTLLTLESARVHHLPVLGVALCSSAEEDPAFAASNAAEIEQASDAKVLGIFPHLPDPTCLGALSNAAEQSGLLDALLRLGE